MMGGGTTLHEAIRLGAKALMVPSMRPRNHSPSHIGLFPVWAMAQESIAVENQHAPVPVA